MPEKYPSELADRFIVRLPDGMRDRISEAAKAAGRSMNAEIVSRLQSTFEPHLRMSPEAVESLRTVLDDHGRRIAEELRADIRRMVESPPPPPPPKKKR